MHMKCLKSLDWGHSWGVIRNGRFLWSGQKDFHGKRWRRGQQCGWIKNRGGKLSMRPLGILQDMGVRRDSSGSDPEYICAQLVLFIITSARCALHSLHSDTPTPPGHYAIASTPTKAMNSMMQLDHEAPFSLALKMAIFLPFSLSLSLRSRP